MAVTVSLSNCELQLWRLNSSRRSLGLTGLEFTFCPNGDRITVKQFSELEPTHSFVAYELQTSNCTYLSSEYLSADVKILCLRLNESVSANTYANETTNSEAAADEIATLSLCPMANTTLPAGCKIDLIIPHQSLHTDSISQLFEIFGDGPGNEKRMSDHIQLPTLIKKDKSQPSITLSSDDLEYLEASTKSKLKRDQYDQTRDSKRDRLSQRRPIPSSPPTSRETPSSPKGEEFLVDNRAKQKEVWEQINAPRGSRNASTTQSMTPNSREDIIQEPRTEWINFAASHALPATRNSATSQGRRLAGGSTPDPRETGGYPQDPNRDYGRTGGQQLPFRGTHGNRRHRGGNRFKAASFIPPTNAPTKRPEPKW